MLLNQKGFILMKGRAKSSVLYIFITKYKLRYFTMKRLHLSLRTV